MIGTIPIICCHPATINPSDLIPPYFTIIVPIAQLKPADKVIRKPMDNMDVHGFGDGKMNTLLKIVI